MHTSAHLGLSIIEDVGRFLAEAGHHFLDRCGRTANLLCQGHSLLSGPVWADDRSWGQCGTSLEKRMGVGLTVCMALAAS